MASSEEQRHNLGPLQKQILMCLAAKGPKNISETARENSAHYKSVHTAFYSLENKGMVTRVGKASYRGRGYDLFWLTENGLLMALLNGADSNLVLSTVKRTFPKHDDTILFAQIVSRLPRKILKVISSMYPSISFKVRVQEVLKLVLMADLSVDDLRRLYDILRESPFKDTADEIIRKAHEKLAQLRKTIGAGR